MEKQSSHPLCSRASIEQAIRGLCGFGLGAACVCSVAVAGARTENRVAPQEHAFTGTVTHLSPGSIELRSGGDTLQFTREPTAKEDLRVGDRVTVYTNLEAKRIQVDPKSKQEAGSKGQEILDDRAFYSASIEQKGKEAASPVPAP